ncbi:hypothetical protein RB195_023820 [Necator americanus]|uniref:Uncharacterized protein n=1 Tax=Necator americanus TaxID=51031 RepID=A0ABR1EKP5_NECAM
MAICTYNACTLASEATTEDLMMQTKKIKYDVISLTETRQRHPLNAVYVNGEELFLGTCENRKVGGVGILVNTSMAKNVDSFEERTTRIGRLPMKRYGHIKIGRGRSPRFLYGPKSSTEKNIFQQDHCW